MLNQRNLTLLECGGGTMVIYLVLRIKGKNLDTSKGQE